MKKEFIVKVQVPLMANFPDAPALIYDRLKSLMLHVPIDEVLATAMDERPKAFFRARFIGEELQLGQEVPDPGW